MGESIKTDALVRQGVGKDQYSGLMELYLQSYIGITEQYQPLMDDGGELEPVLKQGNEKAIAIADQTLN